MASRALTPPVAVDDLIAGRYRIERRLGQGGMGVVYAALDIARGQRVAVKCMTSSSPKLLELFQREYRTLHGLHHARIVEVYDYGIDARGAYYTMELLEGSDLSGCAPLPWRQVCEYLRETASILGVLHARRVLHRDLSARNLWRLPNGHIKLIDFGALCAFGTPAEVVGTPPLIPPEALNAQNVEGGIDQRADLYSLGALGYWLLTSTHAYPATTLGELERCWKREPVRPSSLAQHTGAGSAEPIPAALDELIEALLRQDRAARPASTEVVIDRLNNIAGLPSELAATAVEGYLGSRAFVGRAPEQARALALLREADQGSPAAISLDGAPGIGRTRFLEHFAMLARLSGAIVVSARPAAGQRAWSVANQLALQLFDALPEQARALADRHALELTRLSSELRARLGPGAERESKSVDENKARLQLQAALTSWLSALSSARSIALLVDDLDAIDEESAAWLAALALERTDHPGRWLLIGSIQRGFGSGPGLTVKAFRRATIGLRLPPLAASETHELCRSLFGDPVHLQYLAARLHAASEGNPAFCLELAEYLVERDLIRYGDGMWVLPAHISDAQLPSGRSAAHLARLDSLTPAARALAQTTSLHPRRFTRAGCLATAERDEAPSAEALLELTLAGVVQSNDQSYAFSHESVRQALQSELSGARRSQAERRLAEFILAQAGTDQVERMRAAPYLFRVGEEARAAALVRAGTRQLLYNMSRTSSDIATVLEELVELYRARGRDVYALTPLLALLGVASFFVDRRFAQRYGAAALDNLERMLRFDLARDLRRFIGAKPALSVALLMAAGDLWRHRRHGPSLSDALRLLLGAASALNGVATAGLDPAATARCRAALAPLAELGDDQVAGFVARAIAAIGTLLDDRQSVTMAALQRQRERLETGRPIRGMPDELKHEFLAGSLLSIGVVECMRMSPSVLQLADRLEQFGPLYALSADQLRASFYAGQGDQQRARQCRQRVESQALQLGAVWQIVSYGPVEGYLGALWTSDALLAKRSAQELARLAQELPSLGVEARRARATQLVLHGRFRDVIALLEPDREPRLIVGWSRTRALLARAHNGLAQHARAREICLDVLRELSPVDREYVFMHLQIQIELALAEAGLGHSELASTQLDDLARVHAHAGPLALGLIHEAAVLVALLARDFERAHDRLARLERCYRPTGIGSLIELSGGLKKKLELLERGELDVHDGTLALPRDDVHLLTRLRLIMSHTEAAVRPRAQKGLRIALELTGADTGFLLLMGDDDAGPSVVAEHDPPDAELVSWASERLRGFDRQVTVVETSDSQHDTSIMTRAGLQFCLAPLWTAQANEDVALAAIVLGFRDRRPIQPAQDVLRVIGGYIEPGTA